MAGAGWYPDPGGQVGMFRYWDGQSWSPTVTPNPAGAMIPGTSVPEPHPVAPQAQQQPQPGQGWNAYQPMTVRPGPQYNFAGAGGAQPTARRRAGMWWLMLVALVMAVVLFAWWGLNKAGVGALGGEPVGNPTEEVCPRSSVLDVTPGGTTVDGRVHGGKLSYPQLPVPPWNNPTSEYRVPFGRNALSQEIMVESNYKPNQSWVASVLVAELAAGDGFFSPEAGMEIVGRCIVGTFYGDAVVERDDVVNKATTVDGHDAWLLETHLTFDIPGLRTKGELALIMIVNTGLDSNSIFYASIPDTVPQYVQPARDAMKALTVD